MSKIPRVMSKEVFACATAAVLVGVMAAVYLQQNPIDLAAYWRAADESSDARESKVEPVAEAKTEVAAETSTKPADTTTRPIATDNSTYEFTAQAGDSYTAMVRQALERHNKEHKVDSTSYDALAVEVNLVNTAGAPLLEVGQVVQISESDITTAIDNHAVVVAAATTEVKATAPIAAETDDSNDTSSTDSKKYTYTAKAGDSYTTLVRAAIAKCASDNNTTLTGAQRVAAETTIVVAAGQPSIAIGQTIAIETSQVADAVRTAGALTTEQQAAWLPYATLAGL